ncbi:MAG: 16S rRNA (uracil(1498)-N(3))-methyltransferase [Clostridia bacterium]|nr:16S rRNA (uracil(1498)-N(3))-methyltransferase [Clostridia bacterium]
MHRFLIDPSAIAEGFAPLSLQESQHALKVLRLSDGSPVEAMDGQGRAWRGTLRLHGEGASIQLGEKLANIDAPVSLTLYMGLPKGEKLELIAQKICEMGARRLVPVRMERCVAKIAPGEAEKKLSRPRRIALEAQKQSGRQSEMEIIDPIDMRELADRIKRHEASFLLWENAHGYRLSDAKAQMPDLTDVAAIIGPEGGISEQEADILTASGARTVSLGPRILRAETAAMAACAEIIAFWGDL